MKNIICASVSFAALAFVFVIQSFLLITTSHLVYLYEAVSALELYCAMCILYFSLKSYEQKTGKAFRFLFPKVFSPAFLFSLAVLLDFDFNRLTLISSAVSFLLIVAGLCFVTLSLVLKMPCPAVSSELQILSKRENEIASLLLQGKTTKETADALFVSVSTVKTHIQHIYEKTGVRNRAELACFMHEGESLPPGVQAALSPTPPSPRG